MNKLAKPLTVLFVFLCICLLFSLGFFFDSTIMRKSGNLASYIHVLETTCLDAHFDTKILHIRRIYRPLHMGSITETFGIFALVLLCCFIIISSWRCVCGRICLKTKYVVLPFVSSIMYGTQTSITYAITIYHIRNYLCMSCLEIPEEFCGLPEPLIVV